MASVVNDFPPPHGKKYDKFFDGKPWKLVLGEDCPADLNVAQNALRIAAKRHGIKATVRQSKKDNAIYVQAHVAKKPAKRKAK